MFAIDVVSRIVHVSTAIVLIGGSVFTLLVLIPASKAIPSEAHQALATALNDRWKRFVHVGILLFLVSGFYNYFRAMGQHEGDGLYHALLGIKMLLAFAIFFVASVLVGKSARFERMRQSRPTWLGFIVVAAAVIVCLSGYAKIRGVPAEEVASSDQLGGELLDK